MFEQNDFHLTERNLRLFKRLVEHFIEDGQPVSSRALARDPDLTLSPATIRNIMADLGDLGLLCSPHISAGRIPTDKGYRLFVNSLLRSESTEAFEDYNIEQELKDGSDSTALFTKASEMLSQITHLAAVVMLPRRREQPVLQHLEFIGLSENRVLVVLVNDIEVQNRIIYTSRSYSISELQQASNYLNSICSGQKLTDIKKKLLDDLKIMKDNVAQLMESAIELAQTALDKESTDDYVLAGQTNLMDIEELCDVDKLKKIFASFNQKRDILHLLEQSIHADGLQIFIGEESGYEVLDKCSIVTSPYKAGTQTLGVLGVIGPTRMPYERVIQIVNVTARSLGMALNTRTEDSLY